MRRANSLHVDHPLRATIRVRRACQALALALGGLAGCGNDDGNDDEATPSESSDRSALLGDDEVVRFVSPAPGTVLGGVSPVEMEIRLDSNIEGVWLGLDDAPPTLMRDLPQRWDLNTLAEANGPHTLHLRVDAAGGASHAASLDVEFDNPEQRLVSYDPGQPVYRAGDRIELSLVYSEPGLELSVDFSELDGAFDPSAVVVDDLGEGAYRVAYPLSANGARESGRYAVTATAGDADGRSIESKLPLGLRRLPELPIEITGATFVDLAEPDVVVGAAGAPEVVEVAGKTTLLTGGSTTLTVTWTQDPNNPAERIFVRADGFSGYFVVPLEPSEGESQGRAELTLKLPAFKPGFDDGPFGIGIGIGDGFGQIVDWVTETIAGIAVGGEGIQVTLTWDTDVDLDLELTDPNDNLIDFENTQAGEGRLDLDSNALCAIDGVNAENIAWEPGDEVQGEYAVRVNLYDACGQSTVNWELTAKFCGITETHGGTLSPADADPGGSGTEVTSFVVDCNQRVSGFIRYEKQLQTGGTFPTPVPFAPVRVRTTGDTTLQRGVTDRDGKYDLRFQNLDQDDYYVEVEASIFEEARDADDTFSAVTPLAGGDPYRFKTGTLAGDADIVRTEDVLVTGTIAGAFNVREQVRRGLAWASQNLGSLNNRKLDPLPVHWTHDQVPPGGTSYFLSGELFILSASASAPSGPDHDEFDDPVIMHEFMHYLVNAASFSPLPGGPHSGPSAPGLAFSEGLATLLGQTVLQDPTYVDTFGAGQSISRNLETFTGPYAGTNLLGNIDEHTVASVIWDLLDTGAGEAHDRLANEKTTTFKTLFTWLPGPSRTDQGNNGVDLVDFLDGWRSITPVPSDPLLRCAMDHIAFPYFPATVTCPP